MKYPEDFQPGQIYSFRAPQLSKEEIIAFARNGTRSGCIPTRPTQLAFTAA